MVRTGDDRVTVQSGVSVKIGKAAGLPSMSVVTVVYNAVGALGDTIESVLGQSFERIEYVVIDGGSTDGSVELIERYSEVLDYWISEPDGGIYDAMNKGAAKCHGDYTIFLNAGDRFASNCSLEKFAAAIASEGADPNTFYYTDHWVEYENGFVRRVRARPPGRIWSGMVACHQAIAHPTLPLRTIGYDSGLRLAADYKCLHNAMRSGYQARQLAIEPSVVCTARGVSDERRADVIKEYMEISEGYSGVLRYARMSYFWGRLFGEATKAIIKQALRRVGVQHTVIYRRHR